MERADRICRHPLWRARLAAIAERERDRALTQLSERKLIERAKGLLMEEFAISDEQAMRFLQRKSRNENRKLSLIAQQILAKGDLLK